ncbi:hypothetical protein HYFRA_00005149 [Hymenoscyphus fraxineus]|uniref:Ankyrin n=1 Tax=Hymenoscyphus fraxineus TaxID=746836 RepID=A0A9N9PW58_9HELO|nr:hypothetical protein HYFRA_00005149 [Hymenoscyphus fraxineus]
MTSMVQFAHFSVQEYLQSDNILRGRVSEFHLDPTASNIQSTESCFAYLLFMGSQKPELTVEIFQRFPLFDYARACWPYHFNEIEMLSEHAKPSSTSRSYILALGFLKGDSEAWKLSTTLEIFDYSKKQNDEISWLGTNEKRLRRIVDGQPVLVLGNGAMEPTSFLSLLGFESLLEKILSVTPRSTISASGYSKDDISNKDYLRPPLHNAALGGHVNTVRILLKYGFYVNQRGGLGDSPLHVACIEGNLEVAHILLEAGADVDIKDGHGHPVLLYPCYKNDVALTRLLLEAGADVNAKTSKGIPALLVTVAREVIEMASLLLEFGADVNCRGTSPGTPLETAAQAGDTRMVDLLLRNGADTLGRQRTDWLEEVYTAELRDAVTVRYLQAIDELKFKKKLAWEETKFLSNDSWESILILAEEERDKLERRISDLEETKTVYRYNKYTVKEQEERIRMLRDVRARLRGPDSAAT